MNSASELEIRHVVPLSEGGSDELENLMLVKSNFVKFSDDADRLQLNSIVDEFKKRRTELTLREKEIFESEHAYRGQIERQKNELEAFRNRLLSEQNEREKNFENELQKQRQLIVAQQESLQNQIRQNNETLKAERFYLEELRNKLKTEQRDREAAFETELAEQKARLHQQQESLQAQIKDKDNFLAQERNEIKKMRSALLAEKQEQERMLAIEKEELEKEKERYREESRIKIESNSGTYVNDAITTLDASSKRFHSISVCWSIAGVVALICGVFTGLYFAAHGLSTVTATGDNAWPHVLFYSIKGIIVVGVFMAIARYCFLLGNSFMHESLKSCERRHAINFGKFYLQSYGADANWDQVKDAFEHWNITTSSAFSANSVETIDTKHLDSVSKLIDIIGKVKA